MLNYVYWIYDDTCKDTNDGYIGVSKDPYHRFKVHKRRGRVHGSCKIKILYEGSRERCFEKEHQLRPEPFIGWNNARGGSHGWRYGFSHSETSKDKMKNAWTEERKAAAAIVTRENNKRLIGQKRPKQSAAMKGESNPMYGLTHSEEARKKMSEKQKDKVPWNKLPDVYCKGCGKRYTPCRAARHRKC